MFGGNIKILITGAAAIDLKATQGYRDFGINLCQGYGLTETSPVVAIENNKAHRLGSIGKTLSSVEAKIENPNKEGIGELLVKGPSVMLGYYQNQEATKEVMEDGWFHTGDLAKIDEDGYIYISGRKKSVIVLKNGKNIFPEEMESLVNRIQGVKESFVFGKSVKEDKNDIKIYAKIVYDKDVFSLAKEQEVYDTINKQIKKINHTMPAYKGIKGIILTETPLIKTTTSKIKRQEEIKTIS
jgi:long-chain acyl-CoA synthetase